MKRLKITVVLGLLIASMGYSNVYSMRACFKTCRLRNKNLENINYKNNNGLSPLNQAIRENNLDRAKKLLSQGANPAIADDESGWTALHWVVFKGYDALVEQIVIKNSMLIDIKNNNGKTPNDFLRERIAHVTKMRALNHNDQATYDDDMKSCKNMAQIFSGAPDKK